jgi:hypothetical protein
VLVFSISASHFRNLSQFCEFLARCP